MALYGCIEIVILSVLYMFVYPVDHETVLDWDWNIKKRFYTFV